MPNKICRKAFCFSCLSQQRLAFYETEITRALHKFFRLWLLELTDLKTKIPRLKKRGILELKKLFLFL